jgi:O-methyltransferase
MKPPSYTVRPVAAMLRWLYMSSHLNRHYHYVVPTATYAPWLDDKDFCSIYSRIRSYTMVDMYRCYELWQLAKECSKLPPGAILEVGVWRGGTGCLIASAVPDTRVYLCDTFAGVPKAKVSTADSMYSGGEHADTSEEVVRGLVTSLRLANLRLLKGVFPDETGRLCSDPLRFVHVDVDVYQSGKDVLDWVWPRLLPGGVIVFDDYGFETCSGITKLVEEQRLSADSTVIHNLNGHGILIKRQ